MPTRRKREGDPKWRHSLEYEASYEKLVDHAPVSYTTRPHTYIFLSDLASGRKP
jgi:hypothetical protein